MSNTMHRFRALLSLLPPILLSIALAGTGLILVRRFLPIDTISANDVVGIYLQTFGTIYAVLLAFVVFVVWTQFNETRSHVEAEANAIRQFVRAVEGLSDPSARVIPRRIADYLHRVIREEWRALATEDHEVVRSTAHSLEPVWKALHECNPKTDLEKVYFEVAVTSFNNFLAARTDRIYSSQLRIPFALNGLIFFGGVGVVGAMYFLSLPSLTLHLILTVAMAAMISQILYLIQDLDIYFTGGWQVSHISLTHTLEEILDGHHEAFTLGVANRLEGTDDARARPAKKMEA